MAVDVQLITDDAGLRVARRIDLGSFGLPFDEGAFERDLPWLRSAESWLATEDGEPVGTGRVHSFGLTVPGVATAPISGIGDVGVLPGRRRRGVLGALMGRLLTEGVAAGHVAAALYASEATIYGRFGFGPATRSRKVRIETARAALRPDARPAPGEVEVVEPDRRREVMQPVHERAMARRSGEVARSEVLWDRLLGPSADGSADTRLCLAHRGAGRGWDAYALYTIAADWAVDGPHHVLHVLELVATDPMAELAMWEALLGLDLVRTVEGWMAPDGVLLDALADRWALRTVGEHDTLWVRLLDVPAALAARRYRVPGRLVLRVDPPPREGDAPPVAGAVELDVSADGTARAVPAGGRADLQLGAAELASVWLGGGSLSSLAAVGRVAELTPGALPVADAMFGWSPLPRVTQEF